MKTLRPLAVFLVISALYAGSIGGAEAQLITAILLVSGNGPIGGLDPITEYSINGTTWAPATIVPACCQLGQSLVNYDVIPGTQLIARDSTGTTPITPTTLYRVFFQLPQFFVAPVLQVKMHADNSGSVFLNGTLIGAQPGGTSPPTSNFKNPPSVFFDSTLAHFQPGPNEIRFQVVNIGGPSILDYEAQITFAVTTPPSGINPCANPTIKGTPGNDAIAITTGPHIVDLGAGNDAFVSTGNFNDIICAGPGNDTVASGDGHDIVFGGTGNDTVDGGPGIDVLFGEQGDDTLHGNTGFDVCIDTQGINTITQCP